MLADVHIRMSLVHFDKDVLSACISESMAGGDEGDLAGAGTPMGGGAGLGADGNHYISVNLLSPVLDNPWRFLACYLSEQPVQYPLGTERSLVALNWRCIPYGLVAAETKSANTILWDHELDT